LGTPTKPQASSTFSPTSSDEVLSDALLDLPLKEARQAMTARFERAYATRLLNKHGGNVTRAAEEAGVARNYLHRILKRHGIRGR
jgi:transcriptional regulator of acetoin/glycerol metabolism